MTRSKLFLFLAAVAICNLFRIASAESNERDAVYNVVESAIAADLDSDFPRLVSLLHPTTQRLFRDLLSAKFDELLRAYSLPQISLVSGLVNHPKDLPLSDPEFFVLACEQQRVRHPDFVGDPTILPFNIRETVFRADGRVDVTLSYSRHVQTERTDFGFIRPFTLVFQRDQSRWQMLPCPLARTICWNWSRDLSAVVR